MQEQRKPIVGGNNRNGSINQPLGTACLCKQRIGLVNQLRSIVPLEYISAFDDPPESCQTIRTKD
jgi:hypothetical protein